jgi:lysozyme
VAQTQPVASQSAVLGGVDLSKWQGATVDFSQIKSAGMHYVFVKATQGATGVDPDYKRNVTSAREAGLLVGSYHFYMTNDTPEAQFANLSRHLSLQPGDLPPVVDIEVLSRNSLPDTAANLKRFLSLIESRYGIKPIIYSGEYFANQYLSGFSQYPLWLAEYVANKAPQMPLDWKQWTFWQYTQQGKVAGVAGPVDLSRFNGSLEQLNGLRVMTVPR